MIRFFDFIFNFFLKVLKAFYRILEGFSSNPPNIFILCGRFLSVQKAYGYMEQSIIAFRHLSNILSHFSSIYINSVFFFIFAFKKKN
jgi:hypothetical protein